MQPPAAKAGVFTAQVFVPALPATVAWQPALQAVLEGPDTSLASPRQQQAHLPVAAGSPGAVSPFESPEAQAAAALPQPPPPRKPMAQLDSPRTPTRPARSGSASGGALPGDLGSSCGNSKPLGSSLPSSQLPSLLGGSIGGVTPEQPPGLSPIAASAGEEVDQEEASAPAQPAQPDPSGAFGSRIAFGSHIPCLPQGPEQARMQGPAASQPRVLGFGSAWVPAVPQPPQVPQQQQQLRMPFSAFETTPLLQAQRTPTAHGNGGPLRQALQSSLFAVSPFQVAAPSGCADKFTAAWTAQQQKVAGQPEWVGQLASSLPAPCLELQPMQPAGLFGSLASPNEPAAAEERMLEPSPRADMAQQLSQLSLGDQAEPATPGSVAAQGAEDMGARKLSYGSYGSESEYSGFEDALSTKAGASPVLDLQRSGSHLSLQTVEEEPDQDMPGTPPDIVLVGKGARQRQRGGRGRRHGAKAGAHASSAMLAEGLVGSPRSPAHANKPGGPMQLADVIMPALKKAARAKGEAAQKGPPQAPSQEDGDALEEPEAALVPAPEPDQAPQEPPAAAAKTVYGQRTFADVAREARGEHAPREVRFCGPAPAADAAAEDFDMPEQPAKVIRMCSRIHAEHVSAHCAMRDQSDKAVTAGPWVIWQESNEGGAGAQHAHAEGGLGFSRDPVIQLDRAERRLEPVTAPVKVPVFSLLGF